jgi:putative peptidoglycan lipid II flippase
MFILKKIKFLRLESLAISTLVFLQFGLNFFVQFIVTSNLGFNSFSDVFNSILSINSFFNALIVPLIFSYWLPYLVENKDGDSVNSFNIALQSTILLIGFVFFLFIFIFYCFPYVVFPGFSYEQLDLFYQLILPSLLSTFFIVCSTIFLIKLRIEKRIILSELISTSGIFLTTLFLLLTINSLHLKYFFWISCLRSFLVFLLLFYISGFKFCYLEKISISKNFFNSIKQMFLVNFFSKSGPILDRSFLSLTNQGDLSLYSIVYNLISFIVTVFDRTYVIQRTPSLINDVILGNNTLVKEKIRRIEFLIFNFLFFLIFIVFILLIFNYLKQFQFLYFLNLDEGKIRLMLFIFLYSFGFIFVSICGSFVNNIFYAKNLFNLVSYIGLISFVLFFLSRFIFVPYFGVYGLAISGSIVYLIMYKIQKTILLKKIIS